jgi:hypothetical protein
MTAGVTDLANPQPAPLVPPVDGALTQTPPEKAAALAAAQAAAAAIRPAPTSREDALKKIGELKANKDWAVKYLSGDQAARKEMTDLVKTAYSTAAATDANEELAQRVMTLQKFGFPALDSDAGKDLLAAMSGKPISIETRPGGRGEAFGAHG